MARRYLPVLSLALLGMISLAASFVLTPTPDTFALLDGHRVRIPADMHLVDYAILVLRIGGFVLLAAGVYLTYRRWRPDGILDAEDLRGDGYDPYRDIPPEAGNPAARAGVIRDWRGV